MLVGTQRFLYFNTKDANGKFVVVGPGTAAPPQVTSVTPINGTGSTQTFTSCIPIPPAMPTSARCRCCSTPALNGANACWAFYDRGTNMIYLVNDAGTGFAAGNVTPGGAGTLRTASAPSAAAARLLTPANTLSLPITIAFAPGFIGTQQVYGYVTGFDGQVSGWQLKGTWNPSAPGPPTVTSIVPDERNGQRLQMFNNVHRSGRQRGSEPDGALVQFDFERSRSVLGDLRSRNQ